MQSKNRTNAGKMGWAKAVLLLAACCQALPAAAEGGSYPSVGFLLAIGLAYLFLVPVAATVLVYGAIKLLRRQLQPRSGWIFAVTLATWNSGLVVYAIGLLGPYLSDYQFTIVGLVLVFGIAGVVGVRTATPTTLQ